MRLKVILLTVTALCAFAVGVWLLVSPAIERQADLELQADLLDSILAAIDEADGADYERTFIPLIENVDFVAVEPPHEPIHEHEPPTEPYTPPAPPLEPLNHADFPNGIIPIGVLTIDSIDLRLPIMEGVDEPELRIVPGRVPQTAEVGEIGNAVIAGHRNFTFGSMFNRLGEVEIGNVIEFQAMNGAVMTFEVFEILEITPDNQIAFIQPQHESIITLYTCTPIREATYRLLIRARKIEGGF